MWSSVLIDYIDQKLGGVPYMFNESPFYKVNSTLRKAGIQFEMTPEEQLFNTELLNNIQFFSESVSLKTPKSNDLQKGFLRDYQKQIITNYTEHQKYLIFSSRQTGMKSTLAIAVLHYAMSNPGKKVLLLFSKKERGERLILIIEQLISSLKFAYRPGIEAFNKYSFKFENGSEIETKAYNNHTVKNFVPSVYDWIIFNDCGYVKEIKSYFEPIEKYEQESGSKLKVWGLTTGFNYVNYFCDLFDNAQRKQNEYNCSKISWRQVDGHDDQWKMDMIRNLGSEEEFNKQFECRYDKDNSNKEVLTIQIPLSDLSVEEIEDLTARYKKYFNCDIPVPQNKESA